MIYRFILTGYVDVDTEGTVKADTFEKAKDKVLREYSDLILGEGDVYVRLTEQVPNAQNMKVFEDGRTREFTYSPHLE